MHSSRLQWFPWAIGAIVVVAAGVGEASAIVPIDGGTPTLSPRLINAGPGDQYDPHVSGDIASYTSDSRTRFYDFFSGADATVPFTVGDVDHLSDVSGGRIVFLRDDALGDSAVILYDIAAGTSTEIDPVSFPARTQPAIGGGTVAYIDFLVVATPELIASRIGGPSRRVTTDTRIDQRPGVAPSGDLVVYESCATSTSNCDIRQAAWNGSAWVIVPLTSNAESEANPDTDGTYVVYDATRAGERDIYWQPVGGGFEQRIELPGDQRNPSVRGGFVLFESVAVGESAADLWVYRIDTNRRFRITSTPGDETLNGIDTLVDGSLRLVWSTGDAPARDVIGATVGLPVCPASPEICDGIDNDCDGGVDEGIAVPTSRPQILASKLQPVGSVQLTWSAAPDATGYDVVRGVLSTLRASDGNFTVGVDSCLQDDASQSQAEDAATPPTNDGFWYLVRPVNACSEPGTYDDYWVPSQAFPRDAGIDAAANSCSY